GRVAPVERLAIGNPGGPAATVGRCFLDRTDRCAEFLGRGPRYRLALDESPFWYRDCSRRVYCGHHCAHVRFRGGVGPPPVHGNGRKSVRTSTRRQRRWTFRTSCRWPLSGGDPTPLGPP